MSYSLYKKRHPRSEQSTPVAISKVIDPVVATWAGIWSQQANTFRTVERKKLDVRAYEWGQKNESSFQTVLLPGIESLVPSWQSQTQSYRTPDSKKLDVRLHGPWVQDISYEFTTQSTLAPFSTSFKPTIYTRTYPRPSHSQDVAFIQPFLNSNIGPSVAQYSPVLSPYASFRTPDAPKLSQQLYQWQQRAFGIPFDPALLVGPYSNYQSFQTPAGKTPDVRSYQWVQDTAYIPKVIQVPTLASFSPAMMQLQQSYRTGDRAVMDVRRHQWDVGTTWIQSQASLPIPSWTGAFTQLQGSYRTAQGQVLDPRLATWGTGDGGWITFIVQNPPPPPPGVFITGGDGVASFFSYHT